MRDVTVTLRVGEPGMQRAGAGAPEVHQGGAPPSGGREADSSGGKTKGSERPSKGSNEVGGAQHRDLHIQEYAALRAEQRSRLDAASKIMHYYLLVVGAVLAGFAAVYKTLGPDDAKFLLRIVLLGVPMLSIPFALAYYNEEIIVRNIGNYFDEIKRRLTRMGDPAYWTWEAEHSANRSWILLLTSFSKSAVMLLYSVLSLLLFGVFCGWPSGWNEWVALLLDYALVIIASLVGIRMAAARWRIVKKGRPGPQPTVGPGES